MTETRQKFTVKYHRRRSYGRKCSGYLRVNQGETCLTADGSVMEARTCDTCGTTYCGTTYYFHRPNREASA